MRLIGTDPVEVNGLVLILEVILTVLGLQVYALTRADILNKGRIGNGVTGEVFKVLHKGSGQLMAAKV